MCHHGISGPTAFQQSVFLGHYKRLDRRGIRHFQIRRRTRQKRSPALLAGLRATSRCQIQVKSVSDLSLTQVPEVTPNEVGSVRDVRVYGECMLILEDD